jgi:hypothetical protein
MSIGRKVVVVGVTAMMLVGMVASAGASSSDVYPRAGGWHGMNANGNHPLSFKVAASGKRVGTFVFNVPYTCSPSGRSGVLKFRIPRSVKINSYNGYFYLSTRGYSVPGLTNNVSLQVTGNFKGPYVSRNGTRRATRAAGGVGTNNFETSDGDICNDRFDSWKARG